MRALDGVDLEMPRGRDASRSSASRAAARAMTALTLMRLLPETGRVAAGSVWLDGTDLLAPARVRACATCAGGGSR